MNELVIVSIRCACNAELNRDDRFCRRCGAPVGLANPPQIVSADSRHLAATASAKTILDNRLAVIGLLLVVGPLGLPFLWFSGRFSRAAKIVTTFVYFSLTVVAPLAVAWYWLEVAVRPLVDALAPTWGTH